MWPFMLAVLDHPDLNNEQLFVIRVANGVPLCPVRKGLTTHTSFR